MVAQVWCHWLESFQAPSFIAEMVGAQLLVGCWWGAQLHMFTGQAFQTTFSIFYNDSRLEVLSSARREMKL